MLTNHHFCVVDNIDALRKFNASGAYSGSLRCNLNAGSGVDVNGEWGSCGDNHSLAVGRN